MTTECPNCGTDEQPEESVQKIRQLQGSARKPHVDEVRFYSCRVCDFSSWDLSDYSKEA